MASSSSSSSGILMFGKAAFLSSKYSSSSPSRSCIALAAISPSQSVSSKSLLSLKLKKNHQKTLLHSSSSSSSSSIDIQIKQLRNHHVVFAAESNFLRVIQTVWKVGKDGIQAGTSLVPDTIPRPIARISVTIVAVTVALFLLKSFLSTVFFALAVMGLSYFTFLALNKDEGPKGGGGNTSVEDSLEEARRIMDKYK